MLYSALWIGTVGRIFLAWRSISANGDGNLNKIKLLTVVMLLIYCAFEASKTLTIVAICMLPYVALVSPKPRPVEPPRPAPVRFRAPMRRLESPSR